MSGAIARNNALSGVPIVFPPGGEVLLKISAGGRLGPRREHSGLAQCLRGLLISTACGRSFQGSGMSGHSDG